MSFTFYFHALEKEMATHSCSCLENPRDRGGDPAPVSVRPCSGARVTMTSWEHPASLPVEGGREESPAGRPGPPGSLVSSSDAPGTLSLPVLCNCFSLRKRFSLSTRCWSDCSLSLCCVFSARSHQSTRFVSLVPVTASPWKNALCAPTQCLLNE